MIRQFVKDFLNLPEPVQPLLISIIAYLASYSHKIVSILKKSDGSLKTVTKYFFIVSAFISIIYIFTPNYLDHVEPSIAFNAKLIQHGSDPYLNGTNYPYTLGAYGPVPAASVSLIFSVFKSTVSYSKIPSVFCFILVVILVLRRLRKNLLFVPLVLQLTQFGVLLFWARPEPYLLLATVLSIEVLESKVSQKSKFYALGFLAGWATCSKLYGGIFILLAILLSKIFDETMKKKNLMRFLGSWIVTVTSIFSIFNLSFIGYVKGILMLNRHGINYNNLLWNIGYFLFINTILIFLHIRANFTIGISAIRLVMFLFMQIGVCVIAAKPGSGIWHLIPILFIVSVFTQEALSKTKFVFHFYPALLIGVLTLSALNLAVTARVVTLEWSSNFETATQLSMISKKFPDSVMGVAGGLTYNYTFLKTNLINVEQIDSAAFMDIAQAGGNDNGLLRKLENCTYKHIVIPSNEQPFTIHNFYTPRKFLYSDAIRSEFSKMYKMVWPGKLWNVYECRKLNAR